MEYGTWTGAAARGTELIYRITLSVAAFAAFAAGASMLEALSRRVRVDFRRREIMLLLVQTAKLSLLTLGVVTALGTAGVNVSALVAGLGLTGFALGFALKDAIANMLAAILILLYRPFDISDYIAVAGLEGRVMHIDPRYTTLQHENKKFLIPNSMLFTNTVTVMNGMGVADHQPLAGGR